MEPRLHNNTCLVVGPIELKTTNTRAWLKPDSLSDFGITGLFAAFACLF